MTGKSGSPSQSLARHCQSIDELAGEMLGRSVAVQSGACRCIKEALPENLSRPRCHPN